MQVYNRCIGTRYCNNNCPWKVRRFNWRNYPWPDSLTWQLNPDVTVRSRGVMEKCSFCVQRIRDAEHRAKKERRRVRDDEITPACVEARPADVFTFGDLKDPNSPYRRARPPLLLRARSEHRRSYPKKVQSMPSRWSSGAPLPVDSW
jgi:molybdopterin-containing oxidoreductase family iron-sulfur binding subunit